MNQEELYKDCPKVKWGVFDLPKCFFGNGGYRTPSDCEECVECKENQSNNGSSVIHPIHYTQGIECWDYIISHSMGYLEGNIIKYVTRYKHKNGIEDLRKAQAYINKLIETYECKD